MNKAIRRFAFPIYIFGLVLGLFNGTPAIAQLDTEFWFAAPEVWANHGDQPILLRFSTLDDAANITIEQPANPAFPVQTLSVPANGTQTLNLTPWINMIENEPFNTVLNQGIHITSDAMVSAYYEVNHNLNPDIFALKGSSSLGNSFYIPFQTYLSSGYLESKAGMDIVATVDDTEITIVPTQDLIGYSAGETITITLDAGETFALRAANAAAAAHPSGTLITSSAPIAVTISDDSIVGSPYGGSCRDLLGDQAIPISVAGSEYVAIKGNLSGPDKIFLVGTENGTSVSVDGNFMWTLNAGETYTHTLYNPAAYYETSAPVVALHMTGFGCEVGGAILPPIDCTGSDEVAFVRSTNDFMGLKILVPSGAEGDFTFNGSAANVGAINFSDVPGTGGEWKYANITGSAFVTVNQPSRLTNSTAKFHLGIINGGASSGTRYGYFSDFANYQHETYASDTELCAGEIAELFATPINEATYEWTGPNSFTATGNDIVIGPLTLDDAGLYIVSGTAGGCEILPDTLEINVNPQPTAPDVLNQPLICEGETWTLTALEAAEQWLWLDPNGEEMGTDSVLTFNDAIASQSGTYSLQIVNADCWSEATPIDIQVQQQPQAAFAGYESEVCQGDNWQISSQGPPLTNWIWTAPDGTQQSNFQINIPSISVSDAGWYVLNGSLNGCPVLPDSVELQVILPTPVTISAPDWLCSPSAAIALSTDDAFSGSWSASCGSCISSTGQFNPSVASEGFMDIVYVSSSPCAQVANGTIEIISVPDAGFVDASACLGNGAFNLSANTAGGTWSAECGNCCTSLGVFDTEIAGIGNWEITYEIDGLCPSEATGVFEVTANTSSNFVLQDEACENALGWSVTAENPGGTWSASCGNCINASGWFAPPSASAGNNDITYTIAGECGTTTTQTILVISLPAAQFEYAPTEGCAPAVIGINAPFDPNVTNCQWTVSGPGLNETFECGTNAIPIPSAGCFELSRWVTDASGCVNSYTAEELVCLSAPPSANFQMNPSQPSLFDPLLAVWASDSLTDHTYTWTAPNHAELIGPSQEYSIPQFGLDSFEICLHVVDNIGCPNLNCRSIDLTEGLQAFGPNAFTPDNDGHNDAWRLYTSGEVTRFEIAVYDRWGALVYQSQDPEEYWVGDVLGGTHFAEDGIYHYQAILRDDAYEIKTLQGHILLLR